jgi:hypothetical protein
MQSMEIINVPEQELKSITEFLMEKRLIFHPLISPDGIPDFTGYLGRSYTLIIDRNILTNLISLCTSGSLSDHHMLRIISSIMFWCISNNIQVNSGLALIEYANFKDSNEQSSKENNIFKRIFDVYSPQLWLDVACGRSNRVPIIQPLKNEKSYTFNINSDHCHMHFMIEPQKGLS